MPRTIKDDPLQKFCFKVTFGNSTVCMGFQKISGISREVGVVEYQESGFPYVHKLAGREKVGEVTMEKGMFFSRSLEQDFEKTLKNHLTRQNILIEILDRQGNTRRAYMLYEAFISKWEGTDLDATSDDVAIEKITIQYEYLGAGTSASNVKSVTGSKQYVWDKS